MIVFVLTSIREGLSDYLPNCFALTTHVVLVPITFVDPIYATIFRDKCHSSNPVPLALFPEALIFVPSSINHSANSLTLSFLEITYEEVAVSML